MVTGEFDDIQMEPFCNQLRSEDIDEDDYGDHCVTVEDSHIIERRKCRIPGGMCDNLSWKR